MNFIFWNINQKRIGSTIQQLTNYFDADVLILGESPYKPEELLPILNDQSLSYFYSPGHICEKIQIYTRFKPEFISPIEETTRITARKLFSVKFENVTLIAAHYNSKVNWSNEDQAANSPSFKKLIDSAELASQHDRTIVCGDFNMNPFDYGMIQSTGIHSVMEKSIARKLSRTVDNQDYLYFYNPMWGFLGDLGKGKVSGTMYYSPAKPISYHWNLFDQVICRPSLIDSFDNEYLDIVTEFGSVNLLSNRGLPRGTYSDHLPIKFRFNI